MLPEPIKKAIDAVQKADKEADDARTILNNRLRELGEILLQSQKVEEQG